MVGKLVGQFSDSDRVSQSLQTPSRESKKLKLYQSRGERGGERESGWRVVVRGEYWLSICEPQCEVGKVFASQCGDPGLRRGGEGLTHD